MLLVQFSKQCVQVNSQLKLLHRIPAMPLCITQDISFRRAMLKTNLDGVPELLNQHFARSITLQENRLFIENAQGLKISQPIAAAHLAPQCHKRLDSVCVISVSCTKLLQVFNKPQHVLKTNFSIALGIVLRFEDI